MEVTGSAQYPRTKPWPKNPEGPRTMAQAIDLARLWGVVIPDDVEFVLDDMGLITDPSIDARYFRWRGTPMQSVFWSTFYNLNGRIIVLVRQSVLKSDEEIVAIFAHEMYELEHLRELFATAVGAMTGRRFAELVGPGISGNLHDQAWDHADALVDQMRAGK